MKKGLQINIYGKGWKNESVETIIHEKNIGRSGVKQTLANQVVFLKRFGLAGFYRKMSQRKIQLNPSANLEKSLKGKLTFENYVTITKESAVTLGVNRYPSYNFPLTSPNTYSRLRDIEAPMLGACYLTEWTEGIDELYEVGKEIEVYRDAEDLKEKADRLLGDKQKRMALRQGGQERAQKQHSIKKSIDEIRNKLL